MPLQPPFPQRHTQELSRVPSDGVSAVCVECSRPCRASNPNTAPGTPKRLSEKATIEIRDAEACPAGPSAKSALSLWELRFPIISRGVRKLVDRAGFGMGDDPCSRDDGPCNGEGICPHPRPLSRRERGEKVQVITGKSAPLPSGEGLRGEGHPSPPWHWLIAF